jgi:hypothetical protein
MRESSLVGKRVEGRRDGIGTTWFLICYKYRRRGEAPYTQGYSSAEEQEAFNFEVAGSIPAAPTI